jgi:diaminohydroxyphosphoribosylaminopyrimidine deaminase / 5-amino-6-(5-phosphoribosylamino)uracil reductase
MILMPIDTKYMKMAVRLAEKGAGWVNPNPMVGALIVKDNRIIGKGFHEHFGGPHAEVNAISNAGEEVAGSTLYVTLEPCIHQGKTPPCAPLIAGKGITRVVIGMKDPNPVVAGNGISYLQGKGIDVTVLPLLPEVKELNEAFSKYIVSGMPFCLYKTAMTLDGKIATVGNASRWITGEKSRKYVHVLRQQYAAVMVGVDTVIFDNPLLTTRRNRKNDRNALKVIADSGCRIPMDAKVLENEPQLVVVATTERSDPAKRRELERKGAQVIVCPEKEGRVDLRFVMQALGRMGIDSVLLEGGSTLAFGMLKENLVDKVVSFIAPKILGGQTAPTPVGGEGIEHMEDSIRVHSWSTRSIGEDLVITGYLNHHNGINC